MSITNDDPFEHKLSTGKKLFRYLVFDFMNGEQKLLGETAIKKLFDTYSLPVPNIRKPVISMELRECITRYGLVVVDEDLEDSGQVTFILPHQIKSVKFIIRDTEIVPKNLKKLLKG